MPFEIIAISEPYLSRISKMHIDYLRSPFQGKQGERLLHAYYNTLIKENGGCGYVAISNGQAVGYVCGIWNPTLVKKTLLRNHWKSLLVTSFFVFIQSPKLILDLFLRLMKIKNKEDSTLLNGYELRPIVVDELYRGTQVASLLVSALVADAKKRGYTSIYLLTEQDNIPANKFYQKQGFENIRLFVKSNQEYCLYKRSL